MAADSAHEPEDWAAADSRRPRVIVAEDDADVRAIIALSLLDVGYDVLEAANGADLLDRLGDTFVEGAARPDALVLDVRMPGATGLEILAGLRRAYWETPIVLMTAFADGKTRAEAERFGVAALLVKPFDVDDLVTAVVRTTLLGTGCRTTLPEAERLSIAGVLEAVGGNKRRASRVLGLGRRTLYRKLALYPEPR